MALDLTPLDLSHALPGPTASTMLADYGARVLKLEPPDGGEMSRAWGPPFYGEGQPEAFALTPLAGAIQGATIAAKANRTSRNGPDVSR